MRLEAERVALSSITLVAHVHDHLGVGGHARKDLETRHRVHVVLSCAGASAMTFWSACDATLRGDLHR